MEARRARRDGDRLLDLADLRFAPAGLLAARARDARGQIGDITATMMRIRADSRFVALPDPKALGKMVEIRHGDRVVLAEVRDVGPWNIDDAYWEHDARPASERGHGAYRKPVNTAGIDLSDPVFAELGMRDNDIVEWRFVHRDFTILPRL